MSGRLDGAGSQVGETPDGRTRPASPAAAASGLTWDDDSESAPTRTAEAYREIKRRILEIELLPGASLSEGELAADLGVSKTPAREALARLRAEGLVESSRSGYRVAPITLKAAQELSDLRLLLEPEATARAATRPLDPARLRSLEEVAEVPWDADDPSSITKVMWANTAFHVRLARASGSEKLAEILERVLLELARIQHLAFVLTGIDDGVLHHHTELLDMVVGGRADEAREYIRDHIASTSEQVLRALLSSDVIRSANVLPAPHLNGSS